MTVIGFFNNKGGVGKTSLVYHLSWTFAELGHSVVAVDLDPQANLSAMFMDESSLQKIWEGGGDTVYTGLEPLMKGMGDIKTPKTRECSNDVNLRLIVGDMQLSGVDDELSAQWAHCLDSTTSAERAFRIESAFFRIIQNACEKQEAKYALVDVGPNLGAINRAALLACDYIITPLSPDLFSWQGLRNLSALTTWRKDWEKRKANYDETVKNNNSVVPLPNGDLKLLGYVPMRFAIHSAKPVKSYQRWLSLMPGAFAELQKSASVPKSVDDDPNCLGMLKDYHSLMPMAQEHKKPMFNLTPADGAFGAHYTHAQNCRENFEELAEKIINKIDNA